MTLGNGRRMSLLTAMTIYNFLLHLIGAIQKSMCTFEINKENNFLWNKYFLFQKHFDQMSKIFQDQEHLSKKSFITFSFPTTHLFLSMDLEGLRQKDDRNWFPMKPTAASPGAENKELFMRCWYLGVGELIFDEHGGIDRVAGVGRFLQLFIQLWRVSVSHWWKSHDVTVEH